MCALTDRSTRLVEPHNPLSFLSLVLHARLAPCHRLPLTTAHRESCLCTWRLTRLWNDVRIFLHLGILITCRWDSIKHLSTLLALPLQHDVIVSLANIYNVLVGGFPRNVHLDLVISLDVLDRRAILTNKVTVQRILRALRQGASLRCGETSQCC